MTGRRLLRSTLAILAVAAGSLAGPAGRAAAAPAQEPPTTTATGAGMVVRAQSGEIEADGRFQMYVDISDAPVGSDLFVGIYDPIRTADDLAASTTPTPANVRDTFDPIPLARDVADPLQTTGFTIYLYGAGQKRPSGVPGNWTYRLPQAGVYPIRVLLRGPDGATLSSLVTYLVRRPAADDEPTTPLTRARVALLTSVHQPPVASLAADDTGQPLPSAFTTALDGVLTRFAAVPDLPASFAVTPDTAARLDADPESAALLDALREALGSSARELLDAPYVSLDPAPLVANGLTDELTRQAQLGRTTLDEVLATPRSDTWVVDHPVDAATVEAMGAVGVSHLVLPESTVAGAAAVGTVALPGAAGGIDAVTTGRFAFTAGTAVDPVLAAHQLLGRLSATASLNPAGMAATLRIEPETIDPVELETVLTELARPGAYLQASTLEGVFGAAPNATPVPLTTPNTGGLGEYPALVRSTHQLLGSYGSMLVDGASAVQAHERPLAITASADLEIASRRSLLRREQRQLQANLSGVSVPARDRVTLGARDARFPLPITSTVGRPVKVVITLEASDRLAFPNDTIEATLSGERTMVQIPVRTRATGDTPLRITIRTPDGLVLAESRYRIRSTAVSGVGVLLTIGAGGFLALWWGRHWVRTRRRRGRRVRSSAVDPDLPDTDFLDEDAVTVGAPAADVTPTGSSESYPDRSP